MDAMDASRFCRILEAASVFDLCDLAQRLIRHGVHLLASDPEGHRVLVLFCNRAYELSRDADLISIYDELTKIVKNWDKVFSTSLAVDYFHFIRESWFELVRNHVVQSLICLQNEASKLAIASLKGTLMILSKIAYSHFVVQSIFRNSDDMTVLDCFKEINLEELVTNPNGHFVHQSIVRRFETLDIELCRNICSEIVSRKFDFELHDPGYQVFLTCKSVLRKIGN
ncbi:hypothetical protein Bca52824_089312 [Brassica carinata]|uniref:Uncharacterized protein n=1 Tax=Brassica carinata TaxID=52824 RepID=A0A8X7PHK0_BRACI|nr:hypothetical protein Bca52824_089312 [Brassica carinata]